MENPPLLHDAHHLIGRISVHQDFFWFFSLLVWSLGLIVWWRHPARRAAWVWFPAAAGAAIALAVIQFGMFNPTFDLFVERLVPGTVSTYKPALIDPYWLGDALMGAALAALTAGWGWVALRRRNEWRQFWWLPPAVMTVVTGIHAVDPIRGGLLLALLPVLGVAGLWKETAGAHLARLGLVLSALLPALSPVGPLALLLNSIQRNGPPAPIGLGAAFFQMLVGALMLSGLIRGLWPRLAADTHVVFRRDARWFGLGAILWLAAGLMFGIQTGRDNRREIQQNRLRTTAAHALVFDPALLTPLHDPAFSIALRTAAGEPAPAESAWLASGVAEPAHQRLREVLVSTPFLAEARILLIRDGWLVSALSSNKPAGPLELLRRATPEDVAQWTRKEPYVEEAPVPEIGYDYYCRAPIVGADGQMLGWLDCVRREYFLSVERRWRAAPFLITALGMVLLSLVVVQRQGTRERETALRAAAVSAEASRIKTTFLANVSHELRTPLQSILGYTELLSPGLTDEKSRDRLNALRQQGELMTRLVNDLIDLSAVEAGSFQLTLAPVALAELVRQTVESLRARAEAKGLALQADMARDVPAWIAADDGRLRQVLINLTGNAIKFTDQGAVTVTVRLDREFDGRAQLSVAVRDTGPGVPPAQQSRLFAAFSRLERTATKEGSGLGLALSAALCRAMGGGITLESDGRSGSCFTATFEAAVTIAPGQTPAPATPRTGFAPRVLVVDDNRLVRELFVSALTERGARCREAMTGAEGLARAAEEAPEVLVLDLALPDGDGTDFVPRFRALAPGVRIIGVSAHAGVKDRERALAAGMDSFMVKPVPLDSLWAAVVGSTSVPAGPPGGFELPAPLRERLRKEFMRELPAKRAELAAAVEAGDWTRVRSVTHYLRNSALVVNATGLFEACTRLETAAGTADRVAVAEAWARCRAAFDTLA